MEKSICIIGAGCAGICAARRCFEEGFKNITVFEKSKDVGGLWNYSDEVDVHSSMYENLKTNSIKECISFKDFPIPEYLHTGRSFIKSDEFLRYIDEFAEPIKTYIKFEHQVLKVTRNNSKWVVDVKKTSGYSITMTLKFDVIFICNGANSVPYYPNFAKKYNKASMHSHNYRKAMDYTGKTVAVVGAGPSGVDIAEQLIPYAKKVYLLYKDVKTEPKIMPASIHQLPEPIDATETTLLLSDGTILDDLDMVIYASGYRYNFPFLDKDILEVKQEGKLVSPLFMHCAHCDYLDSFFVLALNYYVDAPLAIEMQVQFAIALMKGEASGFTKEDLEKWEENRLKQLSDNGLTPKHFHFFEHPKTLHQWEYFDQLAKYSNKPNWIPKSVVEMGTLNVLAWAKTPCDYRNFAYRMLNDEEFEVVRIQD